MNCPSNTLAGCQPALLILFLCSTLIGCRQTPNTAHTSPGDDPFFKEKNDDYFDTYPLHNTDSCLIRIKAEIPEHLQAWSCLAVWYRLPRRSPQVSFHWLQLYEENYPHDTVSAFAQMMRGEFLVEMDQYDSAQTVLKDARQRYLALGRLLDASDADYLMARCYNQQNKAAEALEGYLKVLDLINQHDTTFSHRHISLYMDIASTYYTNKDYDQQMRWLRKAQHGDSTKLREAWKYHISIADKMSASYAQMGKFDSSLVMAQSAIDLFRAHVKKPLPAGMLYRQGFAHSKQRNYATAVHYLQQAVQAGTNSPNTFMKNQIEQALGETYYHLGRMDSAEIFTRRGLATPDTGNLAAAHQRLGEIYAQKGDFKAAYYEATRGIAMFKRLFAIERATALSQFDARYGASQKERRIAELEAQHKIAQQRGLIAGLSLLLGASVLLSLYLRQRNRHRILEQDKHLMAQEKALAEALAQLNAQELERSQAALKNTQQELDHTALLLQVKNQFIEALEMRLKSQHLAPEEEDAPSGSSENQDFRRMKILTDDDWARFRERFEQQMPGVLSRLTTQHSDLSAAEVRLFLLLKLRFDTLEISDTLGISKASVWRSRHRLSKKLNLQETGDLDEFVQGF